MASMPGVPGTMPAGQRVADAREVVRAVFSQRVEKHDNGKLEKKELEGTVCVIPKLAISRIFVVRGKCLHPHLPQHARSKFVMWTGADSIKLFLPPGSSENIVSEVVTASACGWALICM